MKVKRFNNLWTMGLIIFCALLVGFYVLKIVCPQFIVGVAEIPSVVKFGQFVDNNKFAFSVFHFTVALIGLYVYSCACCRTYKLNFKNFVILLSFILLGFIIQEFIVALYTSYTYVMLVLMPLCMLFCSKSIEKETFISTTFCFAIDVMAQSLSMQIRNIVLMSNFVNSASMTILLIDGMIWRFLLYCFFNNKKKEV